MSAKANILKVLAKARAFFCDLNHKGGCAEAGLYDYYGAYGTTPDTLKAMEYYKRGCDIEDNNPNTNIDYKQNIAIGCYRVREACLVNHKFSEDKKGKRR